MQSLQQPGSKGIYIRGKALNPEPSLSLNTMSKSLRQAATSEDRPTVTVASDSKPISWSFDRSGEIILKRLLQPPVETGFNRTMFPHSARKGFRELSDNTTISVARTS